MKLQNATEINLILIQSSKDKIIYKLVCKSIIG